MKKRLRKKLGKHLIESGRVAFLRNSATFFCAEKKIIEQYQTLQDSSPSHYLLRHGSVHNGHFRFSQPHHPRSKLIRGIPIYGEHAVDYAQLLAASVLKHTP
ncbi:MAG TPA: hypothetical protein VJH88_01380 [Candidatus Nanoarchaeia archaeon]|nr:hypothetical protein [Candidatus Nanoarchaeia archaeon]